MPNQDDGRRKWESKTRKNVRRGRPWKRRQARQAGDAEGALALLQTMKAGGVQPDIITKFTLVEALMEGWMRQGRPAALLAQAEALNVELHAESD